MPASKKVSATLATEIALNTLQASESLQALGQVVKSTTSAVRAQIQSFKEVGDSVGQYSTQVEGLGRVNEALQAKIEALKNKQQDLNVQTESGARKFEQYQAQIDRLTATMSKNNSTISDAKDKLSYYQSGLASLQEVYRKNNELSQSYVERLRAEGHGFQAQREEIQGTKSALSSLKEQYSLQRAELEKIGSSLGKDNEAYRKQQVRLNETGKTVAETKTKLSELRRSLLGLPKDKKVNIKTNAEKESKHVSHLGEIIKGSAIGAGVASVAMAGLNLVTSHVGDAIDRVDTLNNAKRTFQNMGFHTKDTNKAMKALQDSIMGLPTPLNEATKGVEMMASSTHDVGKAQKVWSALNDAVIGFGGTTDDVARATRELSEAFSNGRIQGKQWNALMNEGLGPALNAIAKEMHMTTGQLRDGLSSGKISVQQFQDALIKLDTKGGGGLKSLHQIAMDSTKGIKTSFTNAVTAITRGLGNIIVGFSTMLKKVTGSNLSQIITKSGKVAEKALDDVSKSLSGVPRVIQRGMPVIKALGSIFKDTLKGAVEACNNVIKGFKSTIDSLFKSCRNGTAFKEFAGFMKDLASHHAIIQSLGSAIGAVAVGIGALKIAGAVRGAVASLFTLLRDNPFGAVVIAITAVISALTALYKHSPKFRAFCHSISEAVGVMVNAIKSTFGDFRRAWEGIENGFNGFCNAIANFSIHLANSVGHWFGSMSSNIKSTVSDAMNTAHRIFSDGYNAIRDLTGSFHSWISDKWNSIRDSVVSIVSNLRDRAHDIFSGMYDRLNDMTHEALSSIKDKWDNMWDSIVSGIRHACSSVGHEVSNLVDNAIRPVNDMLKGITKGINWVLDKFGASKLSYPSIPLVHFAQGGTVGNKGQLAVVNDGIGNHYREMFATPDGQLGAFGTERNIMTFLPNGTQVLDGENSHKLATLLDIPHFKDGTKDKNLFEKIFDKGKDILEDIGDILKHPIKFLEKVLKKFLDIKPSRTWVEGLITHAPQYFAHMGEKWLKKLAEDFKKKEESASVGGFGKIPDVVDGQNLKDLVKKALEANGLSTSADMIAKVMRQIATESGGNAHAVQPGADPDGDGSGPALGLMQTKRSTFNAFKAPGHDDIFNAYDNLLAALNYAKHRYGDSLYFLGQGHGYANGGFINQEQLAMVGEGNLPEIVIPLSSQKQGRALDLLTRTVNIMNQNAGRKTTITNNPNDNSGLESKLDTVIGLLANILGVNQEQLSKSNNGLNLQGLYQKQYNDQALNNYQSY